MTYVVIPFRTVEHEIWTLLVDGVVCQMHHQVVLVGLGRRLVFGCGKTGKTFFEDVHSQGTETSQEHINSEVELQPVYQERVANILLYNQARTFPVLGQLSDLAEQEYSPAL